MGEDNELNLNTLGSVSGGRDEDTEQDAVIWLRHQFEKYKIRNYTLETAKAAIASESDKPRYWRSFISQIGDEVYSDGYIFRFYQNA